MQRIEKKTWPEWFQAILDGRKTFDMRLADFSCQPGDILVLREWDPQTKDYTGRVLEKEITYVGKVQDLKFWSQEDIAKYGFQIMAFEGYPRPSIGIVSAIIERLNEQGHKEILVQTRWKPNRSPLYSGTVEIPAGWIDQYENVYTALKREVHEETGLTVTKIYPEPSTKIFSPRQDAAFAFQSFCCQQQLKNGLPWVGFVFICQVKGKLVAQKEEAKDLRWLTLPQLAKIIKETPANIFTLQLPVLSYYLETQNV